MAVSLLVLSVLSGSASAAPDPVAAASEALTRATRGRVVAEERLDGAKKRVDSLESELGRMASEDEQLTRDLAEAKDAVRQYVIAAYIDGRKAEVASLALDPTDSQALQWKSTITVGQAASAQTVAKRYAELKAAVGPRRSGVAENLEHARQAFTEANNDAIQASALERDAEARLTRERAAAKRREEEARHRAREAQLVAARAAAVAAPNSGLSARGRDGGAVAPGVVGGGSGARGNPTAAESATLARIRRCESGGNYGAVSGTRRYRGAYQFDFNTWAGIGGTGDPAAASPAEQDYRALLLMRARGTRPWPVCGR